LKFSPTASKTNFYDLFQYSREFFISGYYKSEKKKRGIVN
jgi:hypothetical protein